MSFSINPDLLFHIYLAEEQTRGSYKLTFDNVNDYHGFNKMMSFVNEEKTFKGAREGEKTLINLTRDDFKEIRDYLKKKELFPTAEFFVESAKETPLSAKSLSNSWNIKINDHKALEEVRNYLSDSGLYFAGFGVISESKQTADRIKGGPTDEFFDVKTKNPEALELFEIRLTQAAHRKLSAPVIPLGIVQTTAESEVAKNPGIHKSA